jgi:hypothetical protein
VVRVQVPTSLYGASLGKANAWVREQIAFSNPHKPMGDYKLHDDSGRSVSLSALTNGDLDAVNISGVMDTVRINPAHPADLQGFAHSPTPMFSSNLTRFIPDKVTVSMWESAVSEYGAFGATQFLSRLLTEELKGHNMPDPYVQDLLNARRLHVGAPMEKVRLNPTGIEVERAVAGLDLGPYQRAQSKLGKGKMLGIQSKMLDEKVQAYIDDLLDETEVAFKKDKDHGAFMSVANKFSIRYENSKALFEDFAMNVFSPYLVASSANLYALQYINEYVLPTLRTAIENQKDFSRWFIRKGSGRGSGKEAALRELDRQYRHIVKTLATAPSDYYYGKELALIANPAYLFKHVGLVMLPLPQFPAAGKMKKEDGERLERLASLFIQAGNPPEYNKEGGLRVINPSKGPKKPVVEYLGRDLYRSTLKEASDRKTYFASFKEAIHTLAQRVERREGAYSSHALVTTANAMAHKSLKDLYESIDDYPSLYYLDLIGIRPIPTNWPEKLIFAMMEVTASYRDRISGLGKDFTFTDFLAPSGLMMTGGVARYTSKGLRNAEEIRDEILKIRESGADGGGSYDKGKWDKVVEGHARFLDGVVKTYEEVTGERPTRVAAITALDNYLADKTDANKRRLWFNFTPVPNLVNTFLGAVNTSNIDYKDMGDAPSVYKIIGESVKLSIRKYGYEPSGDDVKFVTLLLYFCLRNMKLDKEISKGFMAEMLEAFEETRKSTFDDAYTKFEEKVDKLDTDLGGDFSKLIALMAAREALLEGRGEGGEVRTNPGTVMTSEDSDLMLKKLNELIAAEKTRLKGPSGISDLDSVAEFAMTLFDKEIMEKIKESDFNPVVLGSGVDDTKENMRALIDKMANTINDQVGELITQAAEFFPLINKEDEKSRASTITASLKTLGTTVGLYENLGELTTSLTSDFVRGSDAYKEEQEYLFALNAYAASVRKMFDGLIKDAEKATEKHLAKEDKWGTEFSGYERILVKLLDLSHYVVEAEKKAYVEAEEVNDLYPNHYDLKGRWGFGEWNALKDAFEAWHDETLSASETKRIEAWNYYEYITTWAPMRTNEKGELLYPDFIDDWADTVKNGLKQEYRTVNHFANEGIASVIAKALKDRKAPVYVNAYMDKHYNGFKAKVDKELMRLQKGEIKADKRAKRVDAVTGALKAVKDKSKDIGQKGVGLASKGASSVLSRPEGLATAGLGTTGTALGVVGGAGLTAAAAPAVLGAVGVVAAVKGFQGLLNKTMKATRQGKVELARMKARAEASETVLSKADAQRLLDQAEIARDKNLAKVRELEEAIELTTKEREKNRVDTEAEKAFLEQNFVSALRDLEDQRAIIMADYDKAVGFANSIVEGTIVQISQFDGKKITPNTYDDFEGALTYALMALPEDQHEAVKDEAKAMKATMITKLRAAGETEQAKKFEDLDVEAF